MEIFVARQPVFDDIKNIFAYELLFRDGMSNAFPGIDGDQATSKLLVNTFFSMGLDKLTGGKRALINFTDQLLIKRIPLLFPKESIIVEILEDVKATPDVVAACREMADKGYTLAMDDFVLQSELIPLIEISHLIKMDFRLTSKETIASYIEQLSKYPLKLLAEKVETHQEVEAAKDMGFAYFQGYFFSKPKIIPGHSIQPSKLSLIQIMAEVSKPDFSFDELEQIISRDVSLSYQILRHVNSAYYRRAREISSIEQAMIRLGIKEIKRFVAILTMAKLGEDQPAELLRTSIIRAKFCELAGHYELTYMDEGTLFTLGLFSLMDAILNEKMEKILEDLPLSKTLKTALISRKGEFGGILDIIHYYEMGLWDELNQTSDKLGVDGTRLPEYYFEAVKWAGIWESI